MINTIQLTNIQKGICLMKGANNQNVWITVFSIKLRVWIQSDLRAIYGPITKLNTVIGIKIIKYNFSVVARVLKVTWILQHAYINHINQANNNNTKVNCPADRKWAYFSYEIHKKVDVGWVDNHKTHWWIKFQKAKAVTQAK